VAFLQEACGWTQERIAKRMGKTRRWVGYRLLFASFLNFGTTVPKLENLTEGRFRDLWKATKGTARERFEQVLSMLGNVPPGYARQPIRGQLSTLRIIGAVSLMGHMSCTRPQHPVACCEHCCQPFRDCEPPGRLVLRGLALCYACWDRLTSADPAEPPNFRPVALETLTACQASGSTEALRMRLRTP
jgi:hypothetical protein